MGLYGFPLTASFSNLSSKEVLTPDTVGAYVYKDSALASQGWNMESGFNMNDMVYTFDVVPGSTKAEGTVVLEWMPGFSVAQAPNQALLTPGSTWSDGIFVEVATATIEAKDSSNQPAVSKNYVSGTPYLISLRLSSVTRLLEMSVKDTTWTHGTATPFDGAFGIGTTLTLAKSNVVSHKFRNLRIYNRWLSDAELGGLN
jgi:hypothetical protein